MNPSRPFPTGTNASDTLIDGVHFNLTTLRHWNYTLYLNETLSNETTCVLVFEPYTPPLLLANGTFVNATSCYVPIQPLRAQGITGIVFGVLFATSIVFTLINLRKHGRSFLPREKRWSLVGRRWQYYWQLFIAICGILSTMTGIDVDRNYLQNEAVILRSFFYTLMFPGMLACLWEATRHWNSWLERQSMDADPFAFRAHDFRSKKEFYMPLVFYLFDWLVFFTTIPRPWNLVQKQRSVPQTETVAKPMATDGRFKAGAILACCALIVVVYCAEHATYHYHHLLPQKSNLLWKGVSLKILLGILIMAVRVAYTIVSAWTWAVSPYRVGVRIGWLYGLGYGPALLLLIVFNIYGFLDENDDRSLISQRARRNETADRELGINGRSRKPSRWSRSHAKAGIGADEMLREMVFESSRSPTITASSSTQGDPTSKSWRQSEREERQSNDQDRQSSNDDSSSYAFGSSTWESTSSTAELRPKRENSSANSDRSSRSWQSRPQVVRSMLDV